MGGARSSRRATLALIIVSEVGPYETVGDGLEGTPHADEITARFARSVRTEYWLEGRVTIRRPAS